MKCKTCNIKLTPDNTQPSFWKRGIRKCRKCSLEYTKQWKENNKERRQFLTLRAKRRRRLEIIVAYGGLCECCHEHTTEFLSIQHANGNGKNHREVIGMTGSDPMLKDLKDRGYPVKFDLPDGTPIHIKIMCHNCHYSTDHYGYCPHKTTKSQFGFDTQLRMIGVMADERTR